MSILYHILMRSSSQLEIVNDILLRSMKNTHRDTVPRAIGLSRSSVVPAVYFYFICFLHCSGKCLEGEISVCLLSSSVPLFVLRISQNCREPSALFRKTSGQHMRAANIAKLSLVPAASGGQRRGLDCFRRRLGD